MTPVSGLIAVLGGLLAAFAVLLLWALIEPYRLVVERHRGEVPNLPEEWEGKTLALLCDLHLGMVLGNRLTAERAVRRIVAERPAAALLGGDFVHGTRRPLDLVARLVRPLVEAGIPCYAVLGNHDYAMPTKKDPKNEELARQLIDVLERNGVQVVHNDAVELPLPDGREHSRLYLVGVGAHIPNEDLPEEAVSRVPDGAARVVLMHHPSSYERLPPHSASLALAGHTHGGQVRLPLAPLWKYLTYVKEVRIYVGGWIHEKMIDGYGESGNHLYVSRGIGCSVLPVRLFCPPELTFFTLRRPG